MRTEYDAVNTQSFHHTLLFDFCSQAENKSTALQVLLQVTASDYPLNKTDDISEAK
jgi:hypothetical protein